MNDMTHGFEHQIAQAADGSLAPELRRALDAHLAGCDACRALLVEQREGRALLMGRPIVAVRDLSAGIRRTLEAERPWIDRLNINWRKWSLSTAPIAAALVVIALTLVRTMGSSAAETTAAAADTTIIAPMSETAVGARFAAVEGA
jgi:predicted anti-sigma-YlaC factor YlaD